MRFFSCCCKLFKMFLIGFSSLLIQIHAENEREGKKRALPNIVPRLQIYRMRNCWKWCWFWVLLLLPHIKRKLCESKLSNDEIGTIFRIAFRRNGTGPFFRHLLPQTNFHLHRCCAGRVDYLWRQIKFSYTCQNLHNSCGANRKVMRWMLPRTQKNHHNNGAKDETKRNSTMAKCQQCVELLSAWNPFGWCRSLKHFDFRESKHMHAAGYMHIWCVILIYLGMKICV